MKFTAGLLALWALVPIEVAAAPLSCVGLTACPTLQNIFGQCATFQADEVVCRTESKSLASVGRASRTSFGYYAPPVGYLLVPQTAHGVFQGKGTQGVAASISSAKLYCLWGAAGGGYTAGYCEVRARLIKAN